MRAVVLRQLPGLSTAVLLYGLGLLLGTFAGASFGEPGPPTAGSAVGVWELFSHNAPLLVLMAVGALSVGLVTLLLLMFNGMVVGGLFTAAHADGALWYAFVAVGPHGIFELPAMFMAAAVGFVPVSAVVRIALGHKVDVRTELKDAAILLGSALMLMVPASVLEAWLTPSVLNWTIGGM